MSRRHGSTLPGHPAGARAVASWKLFQQLPPTCFPEGVAPMGIGETLHTRIEGAGSLQAQLIAR